jgi:electron transfer flavoprotein beta subunit
MTYRIIVLVKQVPDTHNVSGDAMKPDGTVNRAALPTVFNPEDLNALEAALQIKDAGGASVTAVTMGPPQAVAVLRQCLFRGADDAVLLSDRRFAGADTLATSYVLSCAIAHLGPFDMVLCGRQAIDGDTAQVGPQVAEKLGINQLTGISEIQAVDGDTLTVKRTVENGYETLRARLPLLLTITADANEPRPPSAKRVMAFKRLDCRPEGDGDGGGLRTCSEQGTIRQWGADTIGAEAERCGLSGSPTKVKKVQSVVLSVADTRQIPNTDEGIAGLMHELIEDNILG